MANPETQKKLAALGALVLPVVAVKTASILLGGAGTLAAHAATPTVATPEAQKESSKPVPPTQREIAAGKYAESLRVESFGPVPLLFASAAKTPSTPGNSTPAPEPISSDSGPIPAFTLNAIMSSSMGQRVLINGRPYRQGDTVRDTIWTVDSINSDKRSVTLRESNSNRTVSIAVEMPQLQ